MAEPNFILASSSPRRLGLLKDIGIIPSQVMAADIDETPQNGELPRHLAQRLAQQKLVAVAKSITQSSYILAADTVVACGRRILPKAETVEQVRDCIALLSGRRHHVYTGMAIQFPDGAVKQRLCESTVVFKRLTKEEIETYVAAGEGIGKAGGYAIQGLAAIYIRAISGSYSNIVGLPLFEVGQLLKDFIKQE